jgi:hypothetical protein
MTRGHHHDGDGGGDGDGVVAFAQGVDSRLVDGRDSTFRRFHCIAEGDSKVNDAASRGRQKADFINLEYN